MNHAKLSNSNAKTYFGLWSFALSHSQDCEEPSKWAIGLRAAALQYITSSIEVSHQ
jgi:hypothetical protein